MGLNESEKKFSTDKVEFEFVEFSWLVTSWVTLPPLAPLIPVI